MDNIPDLGGTARLELLTEERAAMNRLLVTSLVKRGLCPKDFLDEDIRHLHFSDEEFKVLMTISRRVGSTNKLYIEYKKTEEAKGTWKTKTEAEKLALKRSFYYPSQWDDEVLAEDLVQIVAARNAAAEANSQINLELAAGDRSRRSGWGNPFGGVGSRIRSALGLNGRDDVEEVYE